MNVKGKERELYEKFGVWHRLVTFYDHYISRNNIMQVIDLCKEKIDGNEKGNTT